MKRTGILAVLLLESAWIARADAAGAPRSIATVKLTSVDAKAEKLRFKLSGAETGCRLSEGADTRVDGRYASSLTAFHAGDEVKITYYKLGDLLMCSKVEQGSPGAKKARAKQVR